MIFIIALNIAMMRLALMMPLYIFSEFLMVIYILFAITSLLYQCRDLVFAPMLFIGILSLLETTHSEIVESKHLKIAKTSIVMFLTIGALANMAWAVSEYELEFMNVNVPYRHTFSLISVVMTAFTSLLTIIFMILYAKKLSQRTIQYKRLEQYTTITQKDDPQVSEFFK